MSAGWDDEGEPEWLRDVPPLAPPEEYDRRGDIENRKAEAGRPVVATPFNWRDPADIPPRRWLYGRHLLRKFVSLDIAPGGVGKSSLKIVEALSMASGKAVLRPELHESTLRVWLLNLEDPHEEIERRIHAAAIKHGISAADVGDRLFVDSGRDQRCVIAEEGDRGAVIVRPVVDAIIGEILERRIDVLSVDPFVSSHALSENDNRAVDLVAKEWGRIADHCNCSVNLVHHVRKGNGDDATADSARGAKALVDAARSVLVYQRMSKEEAEQASIPPEQARFYFRTSIDKANLAPPDAADWYRMNNVDLPNGDSVGVACQWQWPSLFEGVSASKIRQIQIAIEAGNWRESSQSGEAWVGLVVARVLELDPDDRGARKRITRLIKEWIKSKLLKVVEGMDAKSRPRPFVRVDQWAEVPGQPMPPTEGE